jgi:hypothetical protein
MEQEQLEILKMVEAGQIDAKEAAQLLAALDEVMLPDSEEVRGAAPPLPLGTTERQASQWARFWIYPMMAGGGVLIVGALVMGLVYASGGAKGWLVCGWLPMLMGLTVVVLALGTRRAPWMHLRISEGGKRKIALSFPLPLTLAAWAVRIAQPFVPKLQETGVDDLIVALRDSAVRGKPVFIDVQDDQEGERVELYIG